MECTEWSYIVYKVDRTSGCQRNLKRIAREVGGGLSNFLEPCTILLCILTLQFVFHLTLLLHVLFFYLSYQGHFYTVTKCRGPYKGRGRKVAYLDKPPVKRDCAMHCRTGLNTCYGLLVLSISEANVYITRQVLELDLVSNFPPVWTFYA